MPQRREFACVIVCYIADLANSTWSECNLSCFFLRMCVTSACEHVYVFIQSNKKTVSFFISRRLQVSLPRWFNNKLVARFYRFPLILLIIISLKSVCLALIFLISQYLSSSYIYLNFLKSLSVLAWEIVDGTLRSRNLDTFEK